VLLDKRAGDFYFAYNLVGEYEVKYGEAEEVEHELVLENDLGLAGYIRHDVTLGVEIRKRHRVGRRRGLRRLDVLRGGRP
jgi:hypothetical protein